MASLRKEQPFKSQTCKLQSPPRGMLQSQPGERALMGTTLLCADGWASCPLGIHFPSQPPSKHWFPGWCADWLVVKGYTEF
jgi:hypothetical protein